MRFLHDVHNKYSSERKDERAGSNLKMRLNSDRKPISSQEKGISRLNIQEAAEERE